MSKTGHRLTAEQSGSLAHFCRDMGDKDVDDLGFEAPHWKGRDKEDLLRLAKDVMGWYVFPEELADTVVTLAEIEEKVPCALEDQELPVLLVYEKFTGKKTGADGEKTVYGRYWNPLSEIHDAWQLLEALQKKGTTLLLEPSVFGLDSQTAAGVICRTVLAALDDQKKVIA